MEQKQQNQESKSSGIAKALKQQVLKAWQPVPTINSTIALFGILSVYFLSMGIVLNAYTSEIKQQTFRYDAYCQGYAFCEFPLALDDFYQSPVYFYYQIDNFYQNGRRYVTSKNADQLSGVSNLGVSDLSSCTPVITNGQMNKTLAIDNVTTLDPTAPAIPCGLIAQSVFNDTFYLASDGNDTLIPISSTSIAWPTDINLYKNIDLSQQWLDMEDERFMVWMRVAAMPNFRKLYGIIYQNLPAGRYLVQIQNNYNSSYFAGKKSIVFSTTNEFGGKNQFLSVAYLFVGVASSLVTIGLLLKKYFSRGQKKTM